MPRLTSPMSHTFLSQALCLPFRAVFLGCSLDATPGAGVGLAGPTRHEFSKRFSHFVRLNLARGAKGQPASLLQVCDGERLNGSLETGVGVGHGVNGRGGSTEHAGG